MTYFDAGSALRGLKAVAVAAMTGLLGAGLAGCESANPLLGGGAQTEIAQPPPAAPQPLRTIVLAPLIGAPEGVSGQLTSQLTSAASANKFAVASGRDAKGDFTLRGYMVAARDKAGTKVSYIWDVADSTGKRVHRITGEEIAAAQPNAKDPWASVGEPITKSIAEKTATALGSWLPNQPASAPALASAAPAAPAAAGAGTVEPPAAQNQPASNTTTAAIPRTPDTVAVVPVVAGAPGDGNIALAEALQRELSRQGLSLVDKPGSSYRVEGKVALGVMKDGKQPIQIDWRVKDPQGKALGTVSQKNEIPPGSLDGSWGKTADAAAAAAAQGIVKLLPQPKSTN
jgi:hypothetical protein